MLSSLARFGDDAAGIEKSLRLFQGLSTLAAGFCESPIDAAPWDVARHELALGRRYFRVLKWWPCWNDAYRVFGGEMAPLLKILEVLKLSVLGMYYFLEMPTVTNTMGATSHAWGPVLVLEANKFWFYSIVFSLLIGIYHLFHSTHETPSASSETMPSKTVKEKVEPRPADDHKTARITSTTIFRQFLVDGCDLIIAGSSVGWIAANDKQVGTAYIISTTVAGKLLWDRIQSN